MSFFETHWGPYYRLTSQFFNNLFIQYIILFNIFKILPPKFQYQIHVGGFKLIFFYFSASPDAAAQSATGAICTGLTIFSDYIEVKNMYILPYRYSDNQKTLE